MRLHDVRCIGIGIEVQGSAESAVFQTRDVSAVNFRRLRDFELIVIGHQDFVIGLIFDAF